MSHSCDTTKSDCKNSIGSFLCECHTGFVEISGECRDFDECSDNRIAMSCQQNSSCKNTPGGFECECDEGFEKTENGVCNDIDECLVDNGGCHIIAVCENTIGSKICSCPQGYTLFHKFFLG